MTDTAPSRETTFDDSLNMARQSLYRFASLTLLDPRLGCWEKLDRLRNDPLISAAASLIQELPEAKPEELDRGEHGLDCLDPNEVLRRLPDSPAALNEVYEKTFGLLVSTTCPPYESEYINSKFTFQRSNTMADVGGFYRAFGLSTSATHPERPDHIASELEFMAFLLGLEREAAQGDPTKRQERLEVCRSAQVRFLTEHVAWWTPAFAHLLGEANPGGFYAAAGRFLASLIPVERALLHVPSSGKDGVQPSVVERPEECANCLDSG